jgi:eight-cysteine-cluster-containing protein
MIVHIRKDCPVINGGFMRPMHVSSLLHMNKNRFRHLIPAVSIALIALASCTSAGGVSGGSYSSSSSEGFVWASSYSSSSLSAASAAEGCIIGGCSGEICADEGSEPTVSACIYKESFACYKSARCEKQASGSCGWTRTDDLTSCLQNAEKPE